MKIAMLSPIAWRTPPKKYGPWEQVVSTLTEALIKKGVDVTLFATGNSLTTGALNWICPEPYEENKEIDPKVWESLHISNLMEQAKDFDLIHNHFDFLPLTYSSLIDTPMISTIHGFSSENILPVYQKYNDTTHYISISNSNRHSSLDYLDTIYHGIDPENFPFYKVKEDYLLFFGRIHPDKGTHLAIEIAQKSGYSLKIAGLIQDEHYFNSQIKPFLEEGSVTYLGNAGPVLRAELLGNAMALLHPINFEEPFGLSVAEAMMCGTPVIAFDRGSMKELIISGTTGFLVQSVEEAVQAVHSLDAIHPAVCRLHAENNFSIEKMVSSYIRAYQKIITL